MQSVSPLGMTTPPVKWSERRFGVGVSGAACGQLCELQADRIVIKAGCKPQQVCCGCAALSCTSMGSMGRGKLK